MAATLFFKSGIEIERQLTHQNTTGLVNSWRVGEDEVEIKRPPPPPIRKIHNNKPKIMVRPTPPQIRKSPNLADTRNSLVLNTTLNDFFDVCRK